jgi:hypothetical protein
LIAPIRPVLGTCGPRHRSSQFPPAGFSSAVSTGLSCPLSTFGAFATIVCPGRYPSGAGWKMCSPCWGEPRSNHSPSPPPTVAVAGSPVEYHESVWEPASAARCALSSLYLLPSASSLSIPRPRGSSYRVNGRSSLMIESISFSIASKSPSRSGRSSGNAMS